MPFFTEKKTKRENTLHQGFLSVLAKLFLSAAGNSGKVGCEPVSQPAIETFPEKI